ncbi:MAG: tetratricopeptide repeat protein [Deltaproteobacteria bacterium]|nr:tetratricopeptide repeat protein [Deltaproteobacteria bacterium]
MSAAEEHENTLAADLELNDVAMPSVWLDAPKLASAGHPIYQSLRALEEVHDPNSRSALLCALSDQWAALGAFAPALTAIASSAALTPHNPEVHKRLAPLLARAGRYEEAAIAYLEVSSPLHPDDRRHAARAYGKAGRFDLALDTLTPLLDQIGVTRDDLDLAIELARAASNSPQVIALLGRALAHAESDELRRSDDLDLWVETRGRHTLGQGLDKSAGLDVVDPQHLMVAQALARHDDTQAIALLRELEEPLSASIVRALWTQRPADRELARDELSEQGELLIVTVAMFAEASTLTAPTLRLSAWHGVATMVLNAPVGSVPLRMLCSASLAQALASHPTDPESLTLVERLRAQDPAEAALALRSAVDKLTQGPLGPPAVLEALFAQWLGCARDLRDASSVVEVLARASQLGLALDGQPDDDTLAAQSSTERSQAQALLEALTPLPNTAISENHRALLAWIDLHPGALDALDHAVSPLAPLAVSADERAAQWLRWIRKNPDGSQRHAWLLRAGQPSVGAPSVDDSARSLLLFACWLEESLLGQHSDALGTWLSQLAQTPRAQRRLVAAVAYAVAMHSALPQVRGLTLSALAHPEVLGSRAKLLKTLATHLSASSETHEDTPWRALHSEELSLAQRATMLGEIAETVTESPALLSRWSRTLLASGAPAELTLAVARRFAQRTPNSAEATIAWFSAASVHQRMELLAPSVVAVARSLASARDVAGVLRSAFAQLTSARRTEDLETLLHLVTEDVGLADRPLRAQVVELCRTLTPVSPGVVDSVFETALLAAESTAEVDGLLWTLATRAEQHQDQGAQSLYLLRLAQRGEPERGTLVPWVTALRAMGDGPGLLAALPALLSTELSSTERLEYEWLLAATQHAVGLDEHAARTLTRIGDTDTRFEVRSSVARTLLELGEISQCIGRLTHWATSEFDDRRAGLYLAFAAKVSSEQGAPPSTTFALARDGLLREPERTDSLLLAEQSAVDLALQHEMLRLYVHLDERAAGKHGRAALTYRRAVFLERCGRYTEALESYFSAFAARPATGALTSAITRLAPTHQPMLMVEMHRKLAESTHSARLQVEHLLLAADAAERHLRDPALALKSLLDAQDILRDVRTTERVVRAAHGLRADSPELVRSAFETLTDRSITVASEVWDDDARRGHAMRAFEFAVRELDDPARARTSAELYLRETENEERDATALKVAARRHGLTSRVRDALREIPALRRRASSASREALDAQSSAVATVQSLAAQGNVDDALETARVALSRGEDLVLRGFAQTLAREHQRPEAELALLDTRASTELDAPQESAVLRAVELLRGPLGRLDDAWQRLSSAFARGLHSELSLRVAHELTEALEDKPALIAIIAQRIAIVEEPVERRSLRLRRAELLEDQGAMTDALAELDLVLEDEPSHRPALHRMAQILLHTEQFREAGECLSRSASATSVRSEAAELLTAAGVAFERAEDPLAAHTHYRRALELDPGQRVALAALERVLRATDDLDTLERTALLLASQSEREPDRAELRLVAAHAALSLGAHHRARLLLEQARPHSTPSRVMALDSAIHEAITARGGHSVPPAALSEPEPSTIPESPPTQPDAERRASVTPSALPSNAPHVWMTPEEPLLIEPPPPLARPLPVKLESTRPPNNPLQDLDEARLYKLTEAGDDEAADELVSRLVRTDAGHEEALRLQRERYHRNPARLDLLASIEGLLSRLFRHTHAIAVRTVREVLMGQESRAVPPPLSTLNEAPPEAIARQLVAPQNVPIADLGGLLWESISGLFRREITSYGITGIDRVMPMASTDIARLTSAVGHMLQLPGTPLFVRAQVPGGVLVTRSQPPSVVLASALTQDVPVARYLLGHAMEGTRTSWLLPGLDPHDRQVLVRALMATFGPSGRLSGEPPEVTRRARDLVELLPPRAQKRIEEILEEQSHSAGGFSESLWIEAMEGARARAGLLACGDFAVASQIVVVRSLGGGNANVRDAIATLESLRDLARFAISDFYLRIRWDSASSPNGSRG